MARLAYTDENSSVEIKALATISAVNAAVARCMSTTCCSTVHRCQQRGCLSSRQSASLRVGLTNKCQYQYCAHIPFALKEGVTLAQIGALDNWCELNLEM